MKSEGSGGGHEVQKGEGVEGVGVGRQVWRAAGSFIRCSPWSERAGKVRRRGRAEYVASDEPPGGSGPGSQDAASCLRGPTLQPLRPGAGLRLRRSPAGVLPAPLS